MGFLRRRARKRGKQRGAVAVEFALSLFLLVPLLLGTLDYGYYFWVAMHAVEAANAGARAGARDATFLNCGTLGSASASGVLAVNSEMTKTLLPLTAWTVGPSYTTQTCVVVDTIPCWQVTVRVDFAPPASFMLPFMPAGAAGKTRFITKTVTMPQGGP